MAHVRKRLKYWGIAVQILTYIANGILWVLGLYLTGFAIVIGLSSGTISTEDGKLLDWIALTPATLFLFYGMPLLAVATFGCFASVSANYIAVIIYIVLLALYMVCDAALGISFMAGDGAYDKFISSLKQSQHVYDEVDPLNIGIIPVHPKTYWDHLHQRGKCCGLYSYEDWKNTSMGKTLFSIPDSCCNDQYDYAGCGRMIWKHPDHDDHTIESIIYTRGCLTIFPTSIQSDENESITHLSRFLIAVLFIALLTGIVLAALVLTRTFRTSTGINNPDFIDVPEDPVFARCKEVQVYPAPDSYDKKDANDNEANNPRERKISFDDKGPSFIPVPEERKHTPQRKYTSQRGEDQRHSRDWSRSQGGELRQNRDTSQRERNRTTTAKHESSRYGREI